MKKSLLLFAVVIHCLALVSCNNSSQKSTKEDNNSDQKATKEEASVKEETCVFPTITEQGVEPFFINSSLLDIPSKGSFYDTIFLQKLYDWSEESGEIHGTRTTESEYQRACTEFKDNNIQLIRCYGDAKIVKGGDTIMTIDYDEKATITKVTLLSDNFQMVNGLHVGMAAPELLNDYKANFVTQNEWFDGGSSLSNNIIVDIPSLPKNIIVITECNSKIADFMNKKQQESGNDYDFSYLYKLPSELVNDNVVSQIKIRNSAFDCYYEFYKEF